MKALLIAIAIFGLIACEQGKWGVDEEEDVAVLTKDNFDDFLKRHKFVFVKFYAPWCGHCKAMGPAYTKLSKRMKSDETGIPIAKVDATVETALAEKYGVKGFPSLKFFIDGEPVDYSGAREEDPIFNWIQKKTGPASNELKTVDEVKDLENKKLAVLIYLSETDQDTLKAFNGLAASFDDIPFYYTYNEDVKNLYDTKYNTVFFVFRNFDDGRKFLVSDGSMTTETMKNFLNSHRYPLVMPFEQEAAERIFGSEHPAIFIFTDEKTNDAVQTFTEVAKTKRDSGVLFSQSTITSGLGARLSEFLGITSKDTNGVRLIKFSSGNLLKYKLTDALTQANLAKFVDDFKEGKLTAYFKSENTPETNDQPVKIIVGNTFEDLVISSDKYVLLEAYAPWCGHCKQLEPIYNELAKKLAHVENLTIAKMDATANEHPSLNVRGFPTIKFYKKGEKGAPMDFSGERTVDGFVAFLEKEMGLKLTEGETVTGGDL